MDGIDAAADPPRKLYHLRRLDVVDSVSSKPYPSEIACVLSADVGTIFACHCGAIRLRGEAFGHGAYHGIGATTALASERPAALRQDALEAAAATG